MFQQTRSLEGVCAPETSTSVTRYLVFCLHTNTLTHTTLHIHPSPLLVVVWFAPSLINVPGLESSVVGHRRFCASSRSSTFPPPPPLPPPPITASSCCFMLSFSATVPCVVWCKRVVLNALLSLVSVNSMESEDDNL